MEINGDFFKWLAFVIKLIRIFIEIFGNPDEQEISKKNKVEINGHEV